MDFQLSAVVKEGNSWFIGKIDGLKFKPYKQIKKLKDVNEVASYKPLKAYLKDNGKSVLLAEKLLKELKLNSIYVLDKPSYCDEKEFEEYWWSQYNELCLKCIKKCKQSYKTEIWNCNDYMEK